MRRKTPEEAAWLRENAPKHPQVETRRLFSERFGWDIPAASLSSWMSKNGVRAANSPMRWTPEMDGFFREAVPGRSEAEVAEAFERRFGIRLTPSKIGNRKARLGVKSGTVGGRFEAGHIPVSKGRTWDEIGIPEESRARSLSTCFKSGDAPPNGRAVPVGSERLSKDGYVEVKVRELSDVPGTNRCWRPKHHIVWEESHGQAMPKGSKVVFADRNRLNLDPANLVLVSDADWAVVCKRGLAYHDPESLEAAVLVAQVVRKARSCELRSRACSTCGKTFEPQYTKQRRCRSCIDAGKEEVR